MGIPARLKEIRHALGLSQAALADAIGATKRSVINWEGGAASPSADVLSKYAQIGADTTYILTGHRNPSLPTPPGPALSADEAELLSDYRESHPVVRRSIKTLLREAASSSGGGVAPAPRRRKRA